MFESLSDRLNGVFEKLRAGMVVLDCTSGDPATSRRIASRLDAWDVGFVDAPVSGGVKGAEEGTLTVMCGGDEQHLERARPVIQAFGKKIVEFQAIQWKLARFQLLVSAA